MPSNPCQSDSDRHWKDSTYKEMVQHKVSFYSTMFAENILRSFWGFQNTIYVIFYVSYLQEASLTIYSACSGFWFSWKTAQSEMS